MIGVLYFTGPGFNLPGAPVHVGGGSEIILFGLPAAVCIVLGIGLPTPVVYALPAARLAPVLIDRGIEPVAADPYVLSFGMTTMSAPYIAIAMAPAMVDGAALMMLHCRGREDLVP